jgi:hypothetical protein
MVNENNEVSKPLSCNQKWDAMLPQGKGRTCLKCQKHVTDFRSYSWREIEKVHRENPLPVCGLYSQEQLNNWGRETHVSYHRNFSKLLKYSAAILTFTQLSPFELDAQAKPISVHEKIADQPGVKKAVSTNPRRKIISGTVVRLRGDSTQIPIPNVEVILKYKYAKLRTKTDSLGVYKMDITNKSKYLPEIFSVYFSHPDHPIKKVNFNKHNPEKATVVLSEIEIQQYSVPLIDAGTPHYGVMETEDKPTKKDTVAERKSMWKKFWKK